MNCLVLGGAGFIGSHLVDALLAHGHYVRVFDKKDVSKNNLMQSLNKIEFLEGDFINERDLSGAIKGIDTVFHLVSTTLPETSNQNPCYDIRTNVVSTISLLEKCVKHGIKKFFFLSSGGTVYGIPHFLPISELHPTNPICSYGISKLTIEKYLALFSHLYKLDYVILRPSNIYGERQRTNSIQGVIPVFLAKALLKEPIIVWGDGSVSRDFCHVDDLIEAFILLLHAGIKNKIYNIGSGRPGSLSEIIKLIGTISGKDLRIEYKPNRALDVPINYLDLQLAYSELGWKPRIQLEEGIERTWNWVRSNIDDAGS